MIRPKRPRQLVLFVAAILVPAAVLIGLGFRVVRQETELSQSRLVEERRRATAQLARELTARVEAIRLQEVNRLIRGPGLSFEPPSHPATVLIAEIENDRLILPWERTNSRRAEGSRGFDEHKRTGELREFVRKDFSGAAGAYREALARATEPWEIGEARILLARAEAKAGRSEQAIETYRVLLNDRTVALDEEGVPYRLYAAERLIAAGRDVEAVQALVIADVNASRLRSPTELYLLQSLLQTAADKKAEHARAELAKLTHHTEQVTILAGDLTRVRSRVESADSVWMAYGDQPWLVTVTASARPLPKLLFAISTAALEAPGMKLVGGHTPASDDLGDTLAGLGVEWDSGRFAAPGGRGMATPMYVAGLAFVIGLTMLGGYLLLRDVNRDMRVAEMRSQFVASVSHELKTPLTAIRMFAETLALGRSRDPRTQTEYLETIVNECERLARCWHG